MNIIKEVCILSYDVYEIMFQKCMNALQQVTARDGRPIIVCEKGDSETASYAYKTIEVPPTVDCLQVRNE